MNVFISYSILDKRWVRGELLTRIERAGLEAFIDFRDFTRGAPSIKEMERGVRECDKTLLVLTPNYVKSEWAEFENIMAQTLSPSNQDLRLIPLLKAKCEKPLRIAAFTHIDFTDDADHELAWNQLLASLQAPTASRRHAAVMPTQHDRARGLPKSDSEIDSLFEVRSDFQSEKVAKERVGASARSARDFRGMKAATGVLLTGIVGLIVWQNPEGWSVFGSVMFVLQTVLVVYLVLRIRGVRAGILKKWTALITYAILLVASGLWTFRHDVRGITKDGAGAILALELPNSTAELQMLEQSLAASSEDGRKIRASLSVDWILILLYSLFFFVTAKLLFRKRGLFGGVLSVVVVIAALVAAVCDLAGNHLIAYGALEQVDLTDEHFASDLRGLGRAKWLAFYLAAGLCSFEFLARRRIRESAIGISFAVSAFCGCFVVVWRLSAFYALWFFGPALVGSIWVFFDDDERLLGSESRANDR